MKVVPLVLRTIFWVALMGLSGLLFHLFNRVWLKSKKIRKKLQMQGIKGPPPSFLHGNLTEMHKIQFQATKTASNHADQILAHDYTSTLFPYFEHWRKEYGMNKYVLLSCPLSNFLSVGPPLFVVVINYTPFPIIPFMIHGMKYY